MMKPSFESLIQIRGTGLYALEYPIFCNGLVHKYHGDFKTFEKCNAACPNTQQQSSGEADRKKEK